MKSLNVWHSFYTGTCHTITLLEIYQVHLDHWRILLDCKFHFFFFSFSLFFLLDLCLSGKSYIVLDSFWSGVYLQIFTEKQIHWISHVSGRASTDWPVGFSLVSFATYVNLFLWLFAYTILLTGTYKKIISVASFQSIFSRYQIYGTMWISVLVTLPLLACLNYWLKLLEQLHWLLFPHFTSYRIWGNRFHVGDNSPPWDFPLEAVPIEKNISAPPTTQSSAIENYPSIKEGGHKKKLGPGGIALIVGGGTLVASCAVLYFAIQFNRYRVQKLQILGCDSSMHSLTITTAKGDLVWVCSDHVV